MTGEILTSLKGILQITIIYVGKSDKHHEVSNDSRDSSKPDDCYVHRSLERGLTWCWAASAEVQLQYSFKRNE